MTLLSRLFKSPKEMQSGKVIGIRHVGFPVTVTEGIEDRECHVATETMELAEAKAKELINAAKMEADSIRTAINAEKQVWETKQAKAFEEAKEAGYEAGLIEGRRVGHEEYRENIDFARNLVDSARKDYGDKIQDAEGVILDLSLKVAGKIIGQALKEDKDYYITFVKRALKTARDQKEVELHIHPDHYDFLLSHKEELEAVFPRDTDFFIYPNEELEDSSCLIESANGRIDATVDSQLAEIKQKLLDLLESED
ncbi:flagellar assembly protein FliH [Bacillus massilinigeriensis]|uniref:flagellar assembly protein FliH n=1 Tax=Bacillus mediterraneensis TaxID=1805474 RepID=UPI0008F8B15B|nr:flagellar assembly protein FliH [Bacillus mediterraneensis]